MPWHFDVDSAVKSYQLGLVALVLVFVVTGLHLGARNRRLRRSSRAVRAAEPRPRLFERVTGRILAVLLVLLVTWALLAILWRSAVGR